MSKPNDLDEVSRLVSKTIGNITASGARDDDDIRTVLDSVAKATLKGLDLTKEIDERDVPIAPNIKEWLLSPSFMALSSPPFPKQWEILFNITEDYCPMCSDHTVLSKRSDKFPKIEIRIDTEDFDALDKIQPLFFGVCPECYADKAHFRKLGFHTGVNELAGCAGMRSGKTTVVAMHETYMLHKSIAMRPKPSKVLGLLSSTLQITNVANSKIQASETIWQQFIDLYSDAPWFKYYQDFLDNYERRIGVKLRGEGLTYKLFANKGILCNLLSADKRTIRGRTRIYATVDEIGWFDPDEDRIIGSAVETYRALVRSLRTVRNAIPIVAQKRPQLINTVYPAFMSNISSPSSSFDMIMQLVEGAKDKPNVHSFHYATWEFNPNQKYEQLLIEESGGKPTADFLRDYAAKPGISADPYLEMRLSEIVANMDSRMVNSAQYMTEQRDNKIFLTSMRLNLDPSLSYKRVMSVDLGEALNSVGIVISRLEPKSSNIIAEAVIEILPDIRKMIPVDILSVYENLIHPMAKRYGMDVVYDRWNSADQVARLTREKILAKRIPLTIANIDEFRTAVQHGQVKAPSPEIELVEHGLDLENIKKYPCARLYIQAASERKSGKKIAKFNESISDDLLIALMRSWAHIKENFDTFTNPVRMPGQRPYGGGGAYGRRTNAYSGYGGRGYSPFRR